MRLTLAAVIVSAAALLVVAAPPEEPKASPPAGTTGGGAAPGAAPAAAEVTEYLPHVRHSDPAKAGEAMMRSMNPGKPHEFLARFAGEWEGTLKIYMAGPGAPPAETRTSSSVKLILGGRFIQQTSRSDLMGMPYEHTGITGFSNDRNLFVGSWVNSMSTDIMSMTGSLDKEGKTLTMIGTMNEPTFGEIGKPAKFVWRWNDSGGYTFEAWEIIYGDEFKVVEATYTRKP